MLAGENRESGPGIGGNTTNTLLDHKALGIGMAPETWECFKKARDILSRRMPVIVKSQQERYQRAIDIIREWSVEARWRIDRDPCSPLKFHYGKLPFGDLRLGVHNPGLPDIEINLPYTDYDERRSKNDLDPMRPYLGLPMAHTLNLHRVP